ncbi:MAG: type II toxin-antitoxin system RelE/ParE family toxin [Gammaproteobacteria bacterium]|nr:type II toxin-antitoxin system RelE/ParE family toxin [Gammaproteobacteria bacterium]
MAQINWTEPALSDLDDIASYIALDKVSAANTLVRKAFASVERLEQFPDSGKTPPELEGSQHQEVIVGPCRIFFRVQDSFAFILHVMRSEGKLRKYLIDERAKNKP